MMMSGTIPHSFRFKTEASIVRIDYQINNNGIILKYTKNNNTSWSDKVSDTISGS